MRKTSFFLSLLTVLVGLPFLAGTAQAADPKPVIRDSTYSARFVSQSESDPIVIEAGKTKSVVFTFKNTGTAIWQASGNRYISAYTMEPRDRTSAFASPSWKSKKQTNAIAKITPSGGVTELAVEFTAPKAAGDYTEHFYLAAENYSWVKGGYFFVKFRVVPAKVASSAVEASAPAYKVNRFIQSPETVEAKGGEKVMLVLGLQNVGATAWNDYALVAPRPVSIASEGRLLSFADDTWSGPTTILKKSQPVPSQGYVRETVQFRAPKHAGVYTAEFSLQVNGEDVPGGEITIPVTVTQDAPEYYVEPFQTTLPSPAAPQSYRLPAEPRIRVGLWKPTDFVQFWSQESAYRVYDGENQIGILPANKLGILKYADGVYSFKGGDVDFSTTAYIRLEPDSNPDAVFTLMNFSRRVSWKGPNNFNEYRGVAEYRVTQDGNTLYVINELPLEDYVKGIGENANTSPMEYLKAQTVAQRTYAYYIMNSGKHDKRNFDVVATTGDQLYLGYGSEKIMPRFVDAVAATRGRMVTYEGTVVITPYFGHTDGRTRSWTEVWGGAQKPWLISVRAEYDNGLRLYGHGVGMSQLDASRRAEKEGLDFEALLKHYYTGVVIERFYE
jgi:hypothetical protein